MRVAQISIILLIINFKEITAITIVRCGTPHDPTGTVYFDSCMGTSEF
ncbi:hypothetical protein [Clostridium sp. Marseille-Q2269]|nr:hypothetical protein [Clostridium sp. Marseille-Q2269]